MTRADRPTSPLRCWRIVCVVRIWMFVFLPRGSKLLTQATNWSNALSATRDYWKARGGGYVVPPAPHPPHPPSAERAVACHVSDAGPGCLCRTFCCLEKASGERGAHWGESSCPFFFLYPWLPDNQHAPWQKQTWATGRALPNRHTREIFSVWGFIWLQAAREPNR